MPRVLLADDSPHAQRMGAEILSQEGFEVLGVTDGSQVLENLDHFAPDLVLADVGMPGWSGYEICERIKANPALGHVKVVLLASALEPFDQAEAERVGADGVLHKPFEPGAVVSTLRPLFEGDASAKPGARGRPARKEGLEQAVEAALNQDRVERERVRAAVKAAVEAALPAFADELTERVVDALRQNKR